VSGNGWVGSVSSIKQYWDTANFMNDFEMVPVAPIITGIIIIIISKYGEVK
jgi:hypothetical protein